MGDKGGEVGKNQIKGGHNKGHAYHIKEVRHGNNFLPDTKHYPKHLLIAFDLPLLLVLVLSTKK